MPKAYSYLRFSSAAQREGDSLRRQLKLATEWAAERPDIELDTSVRDLGVSAYKGEHRVRGALASFLERVKSGEIERGSYFLVESFDRLTRENETIAINLLTGITLAGIKVVSLSDGAVYDDKSDAMDLMRAIIVMSRAHEENKARGRKLAAAWADKKRRARENGEKLTKRGPDWLRWDDDLSDFVLIADRAAVVRRMFEEAAQGLGATSIAARLNADGIPPFGKANGWHPDYVLRTLHNQAVIRVYHPTLWHKPAGERAVRTPDGDPIPNYYPRVVEDDLFNRVQAIIAQRFKRGGRRGRRGKGFPNIFMGVGKCPSCGGALILANAVNKARSHQLRCYEAARKHRCENLTRYPTEPLERQLGEFFADALMQEVAATPDETLLIAKQDALAAVNAKVEVLLNQLEAGVPLVADRLRQRQLEIATLEAEIKDLKATIGHEKTKPPVSDLTAEAAALFERMAAADEAERFALRAKLNAILNDVFTWLCPTADGFYAGNDGPYGYAFREGYGAVEMVSRTDVPVTREALALAMSKGYRRGTLSRRAVEKAAA